ncbi:hypothetical protein [Phytopseudomonas dryadis]|uniref:hypothetical protein n=1 Tax=Pseudomonadaceae TaxID=135621 RepID=UPI00103719B8|nr:MULTISPECIES: hypothetical protein [Pseudomonas]
MKLKLSFLLFCLLPLSACEPVVEKKVEDASQSKTAIYLPGGVGLDFGKKPYLDNSGEVRKNGKVFPYADFYFDIDAASESIDQEVNKILDLDGYVRTPKSSQVNKFSVLYKKENYNPVEVTYRQIIEPGLKRRSVVSFWWYK